MQCIRTRGIYMRYVHVVIYVVRTRSIYMRYVHVVIYVVSTDSNQTATTQNGSHTAQRNFCALFCFDTQFTHHI